MLVILFPDYIAATGLDCLCANVSGHPQFWWDEHMSFCSRSLARLFLLNSGRYMLTGFWRISTRVRTPCSFNKARISSVFLPE